VLYPVSVAHVSAEATQLLTWRALLVGLCRSASTALWQQVRPTQRRPPAGSAQAESITGKATAMLGRQVLLASMP
jgi:hypothetical protein